MDEQEKAEAVFCLCGQPGDRVLCEGCWTILLTRGQEAAHGQMMAEHRAENVVDAVKTMLRELNEWEQNTSKSMRVNLIGDLLSTMRQRMIRLLMEADS